MRAALNRQSTISTSVEPIPTTIPKGTILIQTGNESGPEPMRPTDSDSRSRETTVQQPDQTTVKEPQNITTNPNQSRTDRAECDKVSDRVDLKPLNGRLTVEERSASGADRREVGR